jgi:hypothetical protein
MARREASAPPKAASATSAANGNFPSFDDQLRNVIPRRPEAPAERIVMLVERIKEARLST